MKKCSLAHFLAPSYLPPNNNWLSDHPQCGTLEEGGPGGNLTERSLQDAQRLFLMNDVVQPLTVNPLLTQDNLRLSKLVVDIVQGKDTLYHVMYIGTGEQEGRESKNVKDTASFLNKN